MIDKWPRIIRFTIFASCCINFVCLFVHTSNVTLLHILAIAGAVSFFLPNRTRLSPYIMLFAVYIGFVCILDVFVHGNDFHFSQYRMVLLPFFAGIAMHYVKDHSPVYFSVWMLPVLVVGTFVAVLLVLAGGDANTMFSMGRLKLFTKHPSLLGSFSALCLISVVYTLFSRPLLERLRTLRLPGPLGAISPTYLLAMGGAFSFGVLLFTVSRTSLFATLLICLPAVLCCILKQLRSAPGKTLLVLLFLGLAGFLGWQLCPDTISYKTTFSRDIVGAAVDPFEAKTIRTRMPGWQSAVDGIRHAPVTGHGIESYPPWHRKHVYANYQKLCLELTEPMVQNDTLRFTAPHNQYLMVAFEHGALGFIPFILLIAAPLFSGIRHRTFHELTVPLMLYFVIQFLTECPLEGHKMAALGTTVFFMVAGYYGALKGAYSRRIE